MKTNFVWWWRGGWQWGPCPKSFQDHKVLAGIGEGREGWSGVLVNWLKSRDPWIHYHPVQLCKQSVMLPMEKESRLWLGALWEWLWLGTSPSSILQEGCAGYLCLSCNPGWWLWGCFCADGEVTEESPPPLSPGELLRGQFWWGLGSQLRSWGWGCSTPPSGAICRDPSSMPSRERSKSQRSEHNRDFQEIRVFQSREIR